MRNRYILLADFLAVVLCVVAAFVLRLDWLAPLSAGRPFADAVRFSMVVAPLVKLPAFYVLLSTITVHFSQRQGGAA